jgi:cytochrome b pre-mRNA-processing protein 3
MIFPLFRRTCATDTIGLLYGAIVAQARRAEFYDAYEVPDTVDGRFEMIVLHVILIFRRLRDEIETARALGQGVFDRFCKDMDDNLREMGVSDIAVPKKMRAMGEAFYGRAFSYERALAIGDNNALASALGRNVFGSKTEPAATRLAAYVARAVRELAEQDPSALCEGRVHFPDPALVSAEIAA